MIENCHNMLYTVQMYSLYDRHKKLWRCNMEIREYNEKDISISVF